MKSLFIKIFILFPLTITSIANAYAQSNTFEAQYNDGPAALEKFLNKKFDEEFKKSKVDICGISVLFAKFTIDTLGNIKTLNFSNGNDTLQVFKTILATVIRATNGSWKPRSIDGKSVESKPFILPLIYDMEAGCKVYDSQIPNGLENSLRLLLSFDDNSKSQANQLDCMLLSPLRIFSIR